MVDDTGHAYLLVENCFVVLSLQGGTFLPRLAIGHALLRLAWVRQANRAEGGNHGWLPRWLEVEQSFRQAAA